MLSKDQNIINCLSKIQSSTTSVMKTLRSCLNQVNISKTIYSDVDITLDLKKVYDQLKLNETYVTNEQKDLLNFLRSNEKYLFSFINVAKAIRFNIESTIKFA